MSLRRVAFALAATLGMATGAVGATAAQAHPVASGTSICVALVVDGRALDNGVSSGCATVKKGATGVDVLRAAGHTVSFRQDGLLCTIDDLPSSGCTDVDDTHYWAYFHRAPGATSFTYSTEGASTYKPANTSTEGWIYRDGGALTPPENVPYANICKPKPTPKPTPSKTHKAHPTPSKTHHRKHRAGASPSTSATATASPSTSAHRHRVGHGPGQHAKKPKYVSPGLSLSPRPTTSPSASPVAAASDPGSSSSHTGLIIGGIVIAVLGGLAAYRFRRPT
jgi:hypothetical protein